MEMFFNHKLAYTVNNRTYVEENLHGFRSFLMNRESFR